MDVIANTLANANSSHSADGGPYRRKEVVLSPGQPSFADTLSAMVGSGDGVVAEQAMTGVRVTGIVSDNSPFKETYDPGNPDADKRGYVKTPNIDTVTEMVDMMSASRAYEADVTAVNAAKSMAEKALDIGKA
jgi:flagellar basal-body rod protein FlgC